MGFKSTAGSTKCKIYKLPCQESAESADWTLLIPYEDCSNLATTMGAMATITTVTKLFADSDKTIIHADDLFDISGTNCGSIR